ncbi:hypothetical protein RA210_U150076 [Rubrivivax sp. A210]|nr:hypothetical protein RA210_U150076 [Rubrivivax sp. A210]
MKGLLPAARGCAPRITSGLPTSAPLPHRIGAATIRSICATLAARAPTARLSGLSQRSRRDESAAIEDIPSSMHPKEAFMNTTATANPCNCTNCPGAACNCGCQQPAAQQACACSPQCPCGSQCQCGTACACARA